MDSNTKTKRKRWWIAGGLTTVFVISRMGDVDKTSTPPTPAIEPVATFAAPQPKITPMDSEHVPAVDAPPKDTATSEPAVEPEPEPDTTDEPEPSYVYYRNCSAARAAGAAPISEGEPGYARHLDRDGDGIACE